MRFLLQYSEIRKCVYIQDRYNYHRNVKTVNNDKESILKGIGEFYRQDCIDKGELDLEYQEHFIDTMIKANINPDDLVFTDKE